MNLFRLSNCSANFSPIFRGENLAHQRKRIVHSFANCVINPATQMNRSEEKSGRGRRFDKLNKSPRHIRDFLQAAALRDCPFHILIFSATPNSLCWNLSITSLLHLSTLAPFLFFCPFRSKFLFHYYPVRWTCFLFYFRCFAQDFSSFARTPLMPIQNEYQRHLPR